MVAHVLILLLAGVALNCELCEALEDPRETDWRNIANGRPLVDRVGYYDQPGIVIERDGTWVCVITEGDSKEGGDDERVIALRSLDKGRTWPESTDIEPRNEYGPPSAWVVPIQAPRTNRIYAIYTYNSKNITTLPNSTRHIRNDIIGEQVMRYTEDGGKTWSNRHSIPIEEKPIDQTNEYKGEARLGWTVGKPIVAFKEESVVMQFTKRGSVEMDPKLGYIKMENFILTSHNLLTEHDAEKVTWKTLPTGPSGIRATQGDLAEEGDAVMLSSDFLYFAYRTFDGYVNVAISPDKGVTFTEPTYAVYQRQPGGAELSKPVAFLKNPNGPITIRKMANGMYLILFYNNEDNTYWLHHNESLAATWRNPYWISAGKETNIGTKSSIAWSQPEIAFYSTKNIGHGIGYPDIFQDGDGEYYVAETNKETARVHHVPKTFIENMWNQDKPSHAVTKRGLFKTYAADGNTSFFDAPKFPSVFEHASMTLEFWIERINGSIPDNTPLSCTESCEDCNEDLKSIAVNINSTGVWLRVDTFYFHSDPLLADTQKSSYGHNVIVMDGASGILMFINNGILSDGLHLRKYGWYFLNPFMPVPPVTSCILSYDSRIVMRYYSVALTTSEVLGNYQAGPPA